MLVEPALARLTHMIRALTASIACLALAGCGSGSTAEPGTATPSASHSTASASTTASELYPSGDKVREGYPLIVNVDSLDTRVVNSFKGQLVEGQVVALAPGVYMQYNPVEPDLAKYLKGPLSGDCTVIKKFFPATSNSCWPGVLPGSAEPPL